MLSHFRRTFIEHLRLSYCQSLPEIAFIESWLGPNLPLDHFAIIDLPSKHTGIPQLTHLLQLLGFTIRGNGYIESKQNNFVWLAEENNEQHVPQTALPQIVVADFCQDALPVEIQKCLHQYTLKTTPLIDIKPYIKLILEGEFLAFEKLLTYLITYFSGRDWAIPDRYTYDMIYEFNPLLAWVMIFGRKPNHFTLSVHLLPQFNSLHQFNSALMKHTGLIFNKCGGIIKGMPQVGIEQSSTVGIPKAIALSDGQIDLASGFIEFVWRHSTAQNPRYWGDYFTGFITEQANNVIESLN